MTPDWVVLARLERSRGRHGEMYAAMLTSSVERFRDLQVVLVGPDGPLGGGATVDVENAWLHQGRLVLKLSGIGSITEAEKLRGVEVCVPFSERAPLDEGEVYLTDLVGCSLVDPRGNSLGTVEGWQETPGAPLLLDVRAPEGDSYLVPFTKAICHHVDLAARRIEAELPEGLRELNRP